MDLWGEGRGGGRPANSSQTLDALGGKGVVGGHSASLGRTLDGWGGEGGRGVGHSASLSQNLDAWGGGGGGRGLSGNSSLRNSNTHLMELGEVDQEEGEGGVRGLVQQAPSSRKPGPSPFANAQHSRFRGQVGHP